MIAAAPLTVRDALTHYLEKHPQLADTSRREIRYHLNRWERCTDNPAVQQISPDTFNRFRRKCRCAPVTIEGTVNCVLSILVECAARGLIACVPDPGDRLPIPDPVPHIVELEALSAMYRHADVAIWPGTQRQRGVGRGCATVPHSWCAQFWRTFLVVSYFTALRFGDLKKITRAQFRSEALIVKASKTGKTHSFPLHPVLMRHVDGAMWAAEDHPLFPIGGSNHQFRRELQRICKAAGIDGITPQDIRVLSANEWERARPGCGFLIQGSGIRGSARFYLSQCRPLFDAIASFRIPAGFLTEQERAAERLTEDSLLLHFRRMNPERRGLLLNVAASFGNG